MVRSVPGVKVFMGQEYEWGHKGGHPNPHGNNELGILAPTYLNRRAGELVKQNSFFVMSWGESIEFPAAASSENL